MMPVLFKPLTAALVALFLVSANLKAQPAPPTPRPFSIALIGDIAHSQDTEIEAEHLLDDLNADDSLSFVINVGDFRGGTIPCDNDLFQRRLSLFNRSAHPLFYVFGDNEWTDCHRAGAGAFNPFERLSQLRSMFADVNHNTSLGANRWPLRRQLGFPENIRWTRGGVMFIGLHIPGSNNGLSTASQHLAEAKAEFAARNAANLRFLANSFAVAARRNSLAVMVAIQANPWDFVPAERLTGFEDFIVELERLTREFGKPVVLAHGDSHYFRVDKPLPTQRPSEVINTEFPFIMPWESAEPRLSNFTRVEVFGHPNTHWVKVRIDANNPGVFSFEEKIVEKNRKAAP